jgi:hypothetical protein
MLACSSCGNVESPAWFTSSGIWIGLGVLVLIGVVVGSLGLVREAWPARAGALRVGLALAVLLPVAALITQAGDTRIDVVVNGRAPMDGDAWSVACDTFQAAPDDGAALQVAFHDACASATRPARWSAVVLAMAAVALAIDGARRMLRSSADRGLASPAPSLST